MRIMILAVFSMLAVSAGSFAQTPGEIEKALLAAPARGRDATGVIKWSADFTYETLKASTNNLVCYDRSGQAAQQPFAVECTSSANLERVAQSMRIEAENPDPAERRAAFEALEMAGSWIMPEFGSVFINMNGADQAQAGSHTTVAVPGATTASLGLPESGAQGGAWIMLPGTSAAHIMVPGS